MSEVVLKYDGRRTSKAAENDNALANKAWIRLQKKVFRFFFRDGGTFTRTKWGSDEDIHHGVDGHIKTGDWHFRIGLRLQINDGRRGYPYNSFTMRYPGEIQKLCNGDDWTDCKIQGYLSDGWDSNVLSIALISTPNLRNFATNQRKQLKEMQHRTNGIKIYAAFWEDLEINGYGLKKALSSWEIDENFHLPSKPQP